MKQGFIVTLNEELVISETAASAGGHRSLDYLPGAKFLGIAASRLYDNEDPELSFQLFHSGQVKFSDALPLSVNNDIAYPMPLSLHEPKEIKNDPDHKIRNQALKEEDTNKNEHVQYKQLRTGFLTACGDKLSLSTGLRMKTAINPKTRRATEGYLYGYSSLKKDYQFYFELIMDDAIHADIQDKIINELIGIHQFGRSRSAEYGEISIQSCNDIPAERTRTPSNSERLIVYAISDLALQDDQGDATLMPSLQNLFPEVGLVGELDLEHTYLRSRQYSNYNSYYGYREMEKQVIVKGSVLVFNLKEKLSQEDLHHLSSHVGLYQQQGLGHIWLNPKHLMKVDLKIKEIKPLLTVPSVADESDPFIPWLKKRMKSSNTQTETASVAQIYIEQLPQLYTTARQYAGVSQLTPIGPGSTQWGRVQRSAKNAANIKALNTDLFETEHKVCKGDDWDTSAFFNADKDKNNPATTFALWLKNVISDTEGKPNTDSLKVLIRLAREGERLTNTLTNKGNQ